MVHRLHQAGLVEVVAHDLDADIVPIRRADAYADTGLDLELDPLLAMGLPHRSGRTPLHEQTPPSDSDPLTAHIGDAIADALAEADVVPTASPSKLSAVPDAAVEDSGAATTGTIDDSELFDDVEPLEGAEAAPPSSSYRLPSATVGDGSGAEAGDGDRTRPAGGSEPLHHDDLAPTSLDDHGPTDPNAVWLADLYSQFIDEPERRTATRSAAGASPTRWTWPSRPPSRTVRPRCPP